MLLLCCNACADETFLGYGTGVFNNSNTKMINTGIKYELPLGLYWQNKIGYWADNSGVYGRKSSAFGSTGLGLFIDLQPLELGSGGGIGFISSPDSALGGVFPEFNEDLYVGLRDRKGNGIGVVYNHISSGSFYQPNYGRDFVSIQLSQRW